LSLFAKLPGLTLTFILAIISYGIESLPFKPFTVITPEGYVVHPLEAMVIAIVVGLVVGNTILRDKNGSNKLENCNGIINSKKIKAKVAAGVTFSVKSLLPVGIVLMGIKFNILTVFKISADALVLNVLCVVIAYLLTVWICKLLKVDPIMTSLIGIGTAICGGSAIVVAAPIIKADQTQTSIAITIVSMFGLIAIFLYPILGHALGLTQNGFGIWAGTAIQAVPQVVAAGFAFGMVAGEVATIVKMVRILLLAPMVIVVGIKHKDNTTEALHDMEGAVKKVPWHSYFPRFIIVFLVMVVLKTIGVIDWIQNEISLFSFEQVTLFLSEFFMTMAMAGVGLSADLVTMFKTGLKPLIAGFIAAVIMTGFSLIAILLFFNHPLAG